MRYHQSTIAGLVISRLVGWLSASAMAMCFSAAAARAEPPRPMRGSAVATIVPRGPKIDGTLDDPIWRQAPALELADVTSDKPSPQETSARLLIGPDRVYVAFECAERNTAGLNLAASGDAKAMAGDRVEIWLWADPDRPIRHLMIDAAGEIRSDVLYGDSVIPWDAHAEVKTHIENGQGWTATAAIPLRALGAYAGSGLAWRANFTRWRSGHGGMPEFESSWAIFPIDQLSQSEHFGWISGVSVEARSSDAPSASGAAGTRAAASAWPSGPAFAREEMHLHGAGPDETVSNLRIANDRWPDCYDDATALREIFRLEGVTDKDGQAKALALWKWFRILVSATCGGYCYETDAAGNGKYVCDPNEILTVYGHHQCDGMSWSMAGLWRAGGNMGFDECHTGHTIVSLWYEDEDGNWRFHDLDPQSRYYYWDATRKIIGTWTMPVTHDRVDRHLVCSQYIHDLNRSMRDGETIGWLWNNEGHVIPPGVQKAQIVLPREDQYRVGTTTGVYAAVGQETQTLMADVSPGSFARQLYEGSENVAASPADGAQAGTAQRAALHPLKAGQAGVFIYRMQSAYPAVDANLAATLVKGRESDVCRLWLSTDGGFNWQPLYDKKSAGAEDVNIDLGTAARAEAKPNVYTIYDFLIKAEFASDSDADGVGMNALKIIAYRQLNKRTLPNLMPGMNCFRVSFDKLEPGKLLQVRVNYSVNGKPFEVARCIAASPFYFRIDTGDVKEKWLSNYDRAFNIGALRMDSIKFRLLDAAEASIKPDASDSTVTEADFRKAYPHPADMTDIKEVKTPETDPMQTSGFFPQSHKVKHDAAAMDALIHTLQTGATMQQWVAAEALGDYPDSQDALRSEWPSADGDLKMHLCKALAEIGSPRAEKPLLESWAQAPRGAPGSRYIPDVLAAIGDRSVVPALIAPLHGLRFDYRFHIAYALGKLGGFQAEAAMKDLAKNDPFIVVREYARRTLANMQSPPAK